MFKDLLEPKKGDQQTTKSLIESLKKNVKDKDQMIKKLVDEVVEKNLTIKKLCAELDSYRDPILEDEEIDLDDLLLNEDEPKNVP